MATQIITWGRLRCAKKLHHYSIVRPSRRYTTTNVSEYDLVVIGGGSGGLAAAKESACLGARVAVLDYVTPSPRGSHWGLGGTCVNVGCTPKKLMHQAALIADHIQDAKSYGWQVQADKVRHDWNTLRENIQNHIKSINWTTRVELRSKKVEYINGLGVFRDPHTVITDTKKGSRILKAKYFLIAVGGRPKYPNVAGALEYGISSDDIFSLTKPPGKTLVIGAGYVGLECAGFLNSLGFDTTVMVRSVVLRGFDQQMAKMIGESMTDRGVKFLHRCIPKSVEKQGDGKLLCKWTKLDGGEGSDKYDTLLFAVTRQPFTRQLKLDKAGVKIHPESEKIIGTNERSNVPHIYAVGDVLYDTPELAPVAIQAGRLLAKRLFGKSIMTMDYDKIGTTIFTPLEYGCVGFSEEKAKEKFGEDNLEVYHSFFKPAEYVLPQRSIKHCYVKVISQRAGDQKVLGMHILGPHAGEVLQGFAAAVKCDLTIPKLKATVGIYPTVAEEFIRLQITKRSGIDPVPSSCCS